MGGALNVSPYEPMWVHKRVLIMPRGYKIYKRYGYNYYIALLIYYVYYSYTPSCISTFKSSLHWLQRLLS